MPVLGELAKIVVGDAQEDEVVPGDGRGPGRERRIVLRLRVGLVRRAVPTRLHVVLAVDVRLAPESVPSKVSLAGPAWSPPASARALSRQ